MRLRANDFARAWLSVAQASAPKSDDAPVLARTICIEEYTDGLRLIATDRYVLLTAWVDRDGEPGTEPDLDEAPDRTVVAADLDARGKSLAAYIVSLTKDEEDEGDPPLQVDVNFDVRLPAGSAEATLDGLDPTYVTLSVPDVEKVYLPVVEAEYPGWRSMVTGFRPETTKSVALNPEIVERLAKLRKWNPGPLVWRFGGAERAASVEVGDSEPHVSGLVMPVRWTLPGEPTDETP